MLSLYLDALNFVASRRRDYANAMWTLFVVLALAPVGKTGASFDPDAHKLEANGVAVADPRAPSADVARVKAERQARADANDKLRRALSALGNHDDAIVDKATTRTIDYGADGSVTLVLEVDTEGLTLTPPAVPTKKKH
jgi:hypothetical protein